MADLKEKQNNIESTNPNMEGMIELLKVLLTTHFPSYFLRKL
jgi:hypothetical protein